MAPPFMTVSPESVNGAAQERVKAYSLAEGQIDVRASLVDCAPSVGPAITLDALAVLVEQSKCVSKKLNGSEADWRVGYGLRAVSLGAAVATARLLEGTVEGAPRSAQDAQRQLVDRQKLADLKEQTYQEMVVAVDNVTESIAAGVLRSLQERGIEMASSLAEAQRLSIERRRVNAEHLTFDTGPYGDKLLKMQYGREQAFMFTVAGLSSVAVTASIEPNGSHTVFSNNCQVQLSMVDVVQKFICQDFISGELGDRTVASLVRVVEEALLKKAGRH